MTKQTYIENKKDNIGWSIGNLKLEGDLNIQRELDELETLIRQDERKNIEEHYKAMAERYPEFSLLLQYCESDGALFINTGDSKN